MCCRCWAWRQTVAFLQPGVMFMLFKCESVSSQFGRQEYGNVITIPNFPQPLITASCVSQTRFLIFSMTALHATLTICSQKERKRVKHTRLCTLSHPHKECDLSWQFNLGLAGSPCLETCCFLKLSGCWGPLSTIKMPGINHKWSFTHPTLSDSCVTKTRLFLSAKLATTTYDRVKHEQTNESLWLFRILLTRKLLCPVRRICKSRHCYS